VQRPHYPRAAAEDVSIGNHPDLTSSKAYQKSGSLPSAGVTRLPRFNDPVRHPPEPPPLWRRRGRYPAHDGSPPITRITLPACHVRYPGGPNGCMRRLLLGLRRYSGIRTFTFEACSDFTRVTARWTAQPTTAAFVTRLRPAQLPERAARQLPDQSTTLWVESSSTGDSRWPSFAANV
jgi:hypothetical protein